jgi:hypothetical protein
MISVELTKLEATGIHCANRDCKRLPEHTVNILGNVYYIKVDTTVAVITLGGRHEYYCRGCIDEIYAMLRAKLDSKLWAFH